MRLRRGECVSLFFPYRVFRVFVLGWRAPINAPRLHAVSLYQSSQDWHKPKAQGPSVILQATSSFAYSRLAELFLILSLTPVMSLPGQLTKKGLLVAYNAASFLY